MLKKFDVYLLRHIAKTSFGALLFLLIIDLIIQFSGELDSDQHFALMAQLLLLDLPEKILLFLPAGILVGSIMGLGQLAKENELTVVLASGVSKFRLARAGLFFALSLGFMILLAIELGAQSISEKQRNIKQQMGQESRNDIWLRDKNYLVNIQDLLPNGQIAHLHLYQFNNQEAKIIQAKSASYHGHYWQLHETTQLNMTGESVNKNPTIEIWDNSATPESLQQLMQNHDIQTAQQLWRLIQFLENNGIRANSEALQLWQRLFLPLTNAVMLLLALPFVFGNQRHSAQGTRLVLGIMLGVSYYLIQTMLANLALLLGWSPFLGAILPNLLFATGAFYLLKKY